MVKRKLDGAVDGSLVDRKFINQTRLYTTCEKSGGLHLAKPGLTAGWQSSRQAEEFWARLEILKACCRLKYSIFCFV